MSEEKIGFLIRKLYQRNQSAWQELCPDRTVTSAQCSVLGVLTRLGPCSLTELGRESAMDPATTRGVVERLNARSMVSLETDGTDRRKVIVRIEASGKETYNSVYRAVPDIARKTLEPLNPAEIVALKYLLEKLTDQ